VRFFSLVFAALLVSACSKPMPPEAQSAVIGSFDPQQYIGTWYEIARLDNSFEKGLEQVTANYSVNEDGTVKVINRGFNPESGEWKEAIGKAKFVDAPNKDGTRTGRLKVSFFGPFYGDYNIIELDKPYYNYALVSSGKEYLWILSRTPQLTYPIKQHLMAKAKELGFPTHELLFVKQANQVEYESGRHVIPQHN
jgi:apolipoprotein D and lipocalin family protein